MDSSFNRPSEKAVISPEEYIKNRIVPDVHWYQRRSVRYKNLYYFLKVVVIIGGVVVTWLSTSSLPSKDFILGVSGLVIAISSGIDALFQFKESWKVYAAIYLNMDKAIVSFQTKSGDYKSMQSEEAFTLLVSTVENLKNQSTQDLINILTKEK